MKTAAQHGHFEVVTLILSWLNTKKQADEERYDNIIKLCKLWGVEYSRDILMRAVSENMFDIVKLCKAWGATKTEIEIAALRAVENNNIDIVRLCLEWCGGCIDAAKQVAYQKENLETIELCKNWNREISSEGGSQSSESTDTRREQDSEEHDNHSGEHDNHSENAERESLNRDRGNYVVVEVNVCAIILILLIGFLCYSVVFALCGMGERVILPYHEKSIFTETDAEHCLMYGKHFVCR